jgi:hypothetical protein
LRICLLSNLFDVLFTVLQALWVSVSTDLVVDAPTAQQLLAHLPADYWFCVVMCFSNAPQALWVSVSTDLVVDARRDLEALGMLQYEAVKLHVSTVKHTYTH